VCPRNHRGEHLIFLKIHQKTFFFRRGKSGVDTRGKRWLFFIFAKGWLFVYAGSKKFQPGRTEMTPDVQGPFVTCLQKVNVKIANFTKRRKGG